MADIAFSLMFTVGFMVLNQDFRGKTSIDELLAAEMDCA